MVVLPEEERIAWIWCIIIAFAVPEFGTLIRSIRMCIFKSWKKPQSAHFLLVFIMETFHVVGLALMFLAVLPELDVVKGAMLTNCVCFVPGLLGNALSAPPRLRNQNDSPRRRVRARLSRPASS